MSTYEYQTKGTCAKKITVELDGKTIRHVASCPDQLAHALEEAYAAEQAGK